MARVPVLGSVVIPAHNEARVIRAGLEALMAGLPAGALDVVVSCNGCTDGTADVVRRTGLPVRVIEIEEASKPASLRAADQLLHALPRLYLDADVVLPGPAAAAVLNRLRPGGALAARPAAAYDTSASAPVVQRYYRARSSAPRLLQSLWGAGVYGLSAEGRGRFGEFPDVVADDLFVDRLFARDEIEVVDCDPVVVHAPRTRADLVIMLRRSYRGQEEADGRGRTGTSGSLRTLAEVLRHGLHGRRQMHDSATFVRLAMVARHAVHTAGPVRWERDESSRAA
jgi:glycosyltransferase involved in cell wall biosynthesis